MRKTLFALAVLGLFAVPAAAQNLDEIPATAPSNRGPNEQVTPATPDTVAPNGPVIDNSTTRSVDPVLPVEPSGANPVVPGTDPVGGSGITPEQNPQSGAFGANSN